MDELQRWGWLSCAKLDEWKKWPYTMEGEGSRVVVRDKMEDFLLDFDGVLKGV